MKKVVKMVNSELGETALTPDVIDSVFEMWWPKLETQIKEAEEKAKSVDNKDLRTERDLIEEVLSLTREISINRRFERERIFSPRALEDIIVSVERLTEAVYGKGDFELIDYIKDLHRPLEYFIEEVMNSSSTGVRKELYSRYRRSKIMLEDMLSSPEQRITTRVRKIKLDNDESK